MKDISIITLDEVEKYIHKKTFLIVLSVWCSGYHRRQQRKTLRRQSFIFYLVVGPVTKHVSPTCVCRPGPCARRGGGRVRKRYLFNSAHKLCTNASHALAWKL